MRKIRNTIVGVFCALLLAGSAFAADTTVKATTNAPVAVTTGMTAPAPSLRGWQVTVGGVGTTTASSFGDNWQWGGELGLSKQVKVDLGTSFITDLGLRQSVSYGTVGESPWCKIVTVDAPCTIPYDKEVCGVDKKDGWKLRTELFWDWNIPITEKFSFFIGPNAGVTYGNITPQWTVGPEAGFKYAFNQQWFAFTRVNYDFNLSDGPNAFRVGAGIGFVF